MSTVPDELAFRRTDSVAPAPDEAVAAAPVPVVAVVVPPAAMPQIPAAIKLLSDSVAVDVMVPTGDGATPLMPPASCGLVAAATV